MKTLKLKKNILGLVFSLTTVVAMVITSSACFFFVAHDGGEDISLPAHLQI